MGVALLGSATLLGALNGGKASALYFNFSFSGTVSPTSPASVTGIITGLLDNTNDQKSGLSITITSATYTPPSGWPVFTDYFSGSGIDVSGGSITGANITLQQGNYQNLLFLGNQEFFTPELNQVISGIYIVDSGPSNNSLVFTPLAPPANVPGPLPLLGAAAAFRVSRQLRSRIKSSV